MKCLEITKMDLLLCARMGSSRLPGKALMEIAEGKNSLDIIINKVHSVIPSAKVILATTSSPKDDILANWGEKKRINVFRGSEDDVLGRIAGAVEQFNLDNIIEILGDNPLIPQEIILNALEKYNNINEDNKYVASATSEYKFIKTGNLFPIGIRVQIFSRKFIQNLEKAATSSQEREHATSYIYNRPDFSNIELTFPKFDIEPIISSHNFAINTQDQLDDAREIYSAFGRNCTVKNLVNWIESK
jgi:spore coat polysaccharide biosynthesis protein SpsF